MILYGYMAIIIFHILWVYDPGFRQCTSCNICTSGRYVILRCCSLPGVFLFVLLLLSCIVFCCIFLYISVAFLVWHPCYFVVDVLIISCSQFLAIFLVFTFSFNIYFGVSIFFSSLVYFPTVFLVTLFHCRFCLCIFSPGFQFWYLSFCDPIPISFWNAVHIVFQQLCSHHTFTFTAWQNLNLTIVVHFNLMLHIQHASRWT